MLTPPRRVQELASMAALLVALSSRVVQVQPAHDNRIIVDVMRLHNDTGQVLCALFATPAAFPRRTQEAVAHARSDISQGHASCEFSNIAPGRYAVSVFHDENSNGKLDTKFMGIPREGVGASNNATGHFGPPSFDAASFLFSGEHLHLTITIIYL